MNLKINGCGVHRRGTNPWVIMWLMVSFSLFPLRQFSTASMVVVANPIEQGETVSGTVESISLDSHTIRIRNALGQSLLLKLTQSHLLEHVTQGEHVTVVVNEKHEIIKLIVTPIPELAPGHSPRQ